VEGETLRATFSAEEGSSSIDLTKTPGSSDEYQIGAVSFFTEERGLDRKIEVLDFHRDAKFGAIGKKYRVGVYRSEAGAPATVVWDFVIDDFRFNPVVKDEAVTFDPSKVSQILDVETGKLIKGHWEHPGN
jgi:hypothetical protein